MLAKAVANNRLAKRKAKADHRASKPQSDRQLSHSQASTSSAQAVSSEPAQPVKRHSPPAVAIGSSKRSVKTKATKALATDKLASAASSGVRSRAQRRASTRSGRHSGWGKESLGEGSRQDGSVVNARLGSVAETEAGLGTAVGGLFKVHTSMPAMPHCHGLSAKLLICAPVTAMSS